MADINALYASLLAADEARDAAALTAVAWQMYGELATTAADLGALRAPVPGSCGRAARQRQAAVGPARSRDRRLRGGCVAGRRGHTGRCQCR